MYKKFGSAQSILGPVRGQGIRFLSVKVWKNKQKLEKCLQFYKCNNLKVESHVSNFSQMVAINPETQVFFSLGHTCLVLFTLFDCSQSKVLPLFRKVNPCKVIIYKSSNELFFIKHNLRFGLVLWPVGITGILWFPQCQFLQSSKSRLILRALFYVFIGKIRKTYICTL